MLGRERSFDASFGFVFLPFVIADYADDDGTANHHQACLKVCHAACTLKWKFVAQMALFKKEIGYDFFKNTGRIMSRSKRLPTIHFSRLMTQENQGGGDT